MSVNQREYGEFIPQEQPMNDALGTISSGIKNSNYAVAFTGAGISAECGIPTYRGNDGLWKKYDPSLYANISYFLQDPSYYWNFFREVRYPLLKKAEPGTVHRALAELEAAGNLRTIITQNIDGLHQEAGSSSVIELHGTTKVIFCMNCSNRYSMEEAYALLKDRCPPLCTECHGNLRPAVVFFGEALDPQVLCAAFRETERCDFLLVLGSSLVVHPAAEIPMAVKQKEGFLAIINKERTALDHLADVVIHEEAGRVLPQIVRNLKK
jgi:NAD-dependent deacetylase